MGLIPQEYFRNLSPGKVWPECFLHSPPWFLNPVLPESQALSSSPRVVIMSSILEHMCADVLQQTATQIKFPSTGMDTMPYWNLLPPKRPIKEVLTDIFAKVLEKGWVDSRSIHIFDTLLHMGGVYWFCNNLIKVVGVG